VVEKKNLTKMLQIQSFEFLFTLMDLTGLD
jgi:hypothetical protein